MVKRLARKRYASSAETLLGRLVAFAESESPDEAEERRTLADVLSHGPVLVVGDAHHEVLADTAEMLCWSAADVARFRAELRGFLRGLIDLTSDDEAGALVPQVAVKHVTFGAAFDGGRVLLTVDGGARDVLGLQALELLRSVGVGRVRKCECGRLFVKSGRREYCSLRCQKGVYMRAFRQREREQNKRERRSRHGRTARKR